MESFYNSPAPLPPAPAGEALAFHRRLPGYAPGPVVELPALAAALGLGRLSAKLETDRFGLPAFKALGAFYAAYRAVLREYGRGEPAWRDLAELRAALSAERPLTLVAATDGNHGRAVARFAALLGLGARIYVPEDMALPRREAIAAEGAAVVVVAGSYDDAVARSAAEAGPDEAVISDTAWEGYEAVPRDVIAGYGTLLHEADAALGGLPDLVVVQMGVGALAAAVVDHYAGGPTRVLGVEPESAACVLAALRAGRPVAVPGPHRSIMAGLNCGLVSPLAWPTLRAGLAAALAVPDEAAREAMRALAAAGIEAGETGAAGLAGLTALLTGPGADEARARLGLGPRAHALVLVTEGPTDPAAYTAIVGSAPKKASSSA